MLSPTCVCRKPDRASLPGPGADTGAVGAPCSTPALAAHPRPAPAPPPRGGGQGQAGGGMASSAPAARTHRGETHSTDPGRREGTLHGPPRPDTPEATWEAAPPQPGHPKPRPPPGQPYPGRGAARPCPAAAPSHRRLRPGSGSSPAAAAGTGTAARTPRPPALPAHLCGEGSWPRPPLMRALAVAN